ncbi:SDR family NAD(P)-dependent oxidoreductase [Chloroflexota bacterium]
MVFAQAGADVAICSRTLNNGELEAVAKEINGFGRHSLAIQADISQKADVVNLVQKVTSTFGAIDILVNNAGIQIREPLLSMSENDWDNIIDNVLKGHYLCSQAVARRMCELRKSCIINITSHLAFKPAPEVGAYCIAKAGVEMLTRVLARELGSYNIRVNYIAPGIVKTERAQNMWNNPEWLKQREALIPLGRIAELKDVTSAALFLATDLSSYITGHTLFIDGGGLAQ